MSPMQRLKRWWYQLETPDNTKPSCPACGGAALSILTVNFKGVTAEPEIYFYRCDATACNTVVITNRALRATSKAGA